MPDQTDPAVVRVLREFRDLLDGREDGVMRAMAGSWLDIERKLDADITALAYEIAKRREEGTIITEQILWRMDRYKSLKAQMEAEILAWNKRYAIPTMENAQREFAALGLQASQSAITASYAVGVGPYWNRINIGAVETMIGFLGDGTPLNRLLRRDYPEALDGLTRALINGIARGFHPSQIAREMADGMGMGLERALLITRTECARTYRMASTKQYRESGVVSGFYRLVKKSTACAGCLFLDGEKFELADELEDHPRGKCIAVPQVQGVRRPRWQTGIQWFGEQDPEKQRAILGAERYELWKSGAIKLSDIPRVHHSDVWGDSPRVATIKELTEATP